MFDFRYHAISLAAVLIALAIGLLLGVAIGDRQLVSSAERNLREDIEKRLGDARDDLRAAREELDRSRIYEERTFGALVGGRLQRRRVAVVFVHDTGRQAYEPIRQAVEAAGGDLTSVSTLREPFDPAALAEAAAGTRYTEMAEDPELQDAFARRMGEQLVAGGRLIQEVRRELLASSSGTLERAEAVVLVRGEPGDGRVPERFVSAFVDGLREFETPVVGVELTSTDPSEIPWYEDHDLPSVDNVDEIPGRASLVVALAGAAEGSYGIKRTADALIPEALIGG